MNGRILNGKTIKVGLTNELNAGNLKTNTENANETLNRASNKLEIKRRESSFDDDNDRKLSITSRIKKNH